MAVVLGRMDNELLDVARPIQVVTTEEVTRPDFRSGLSHLNDVAGGTANHRHPEERLLQGVSIGMTLPLQQCLGGRLAERLRTGVTAPLPELGSSRSRFGPKLGRCTDERVP